LFTLTKKKETGITTVRVIDSVKCQDYSVAKWFVQVSLDSAPEKREAFEVYAIHDGTLLVDAVNVDDNLYSKIKTGAAFNKVVSVDLSGTGASQVMQLKITASASVSVTATRLEVNY
jgi:hypothetical protein